jgi:putative ABC transport system substrate-binding protein
VNRLLSGFLLFASMLFAMCVASGESFAQTKQLRVGVLMTHGEDVATWFPAYLRVLQDHGWVEGQNVVFEYRSGHSDPLQIARGASELVQDNVDVMLAIGPPAVRAAYESTHRIPIVAHDLESDPVAAGYAESYGHPGRNLTGMFLDTPEVATKLLQFLQEIVPGLSRVVVLVDPSSGPAFLIAIKRIAPSAGIHLQIVEVHNSQEIAKAASVFSGRPQALVVLPSPLMFVQSPELAKLANKRRLPAISIFSRFVDAGGLLAYGTAGAEDQFAVLTAKVLSGTKPADLPIERPSKFLLGVNLKTAKALKVEIPQSILLQADQTVR